MPPLIVDGVCRFAMFGVCFRPWVNILDIHIESSDGDSRPDHIRDQAEIINQEWPLKVNAVLAPNWQYQGCRWVDLDTADGSTGETTETSGAAVLPILGIASGQALPPNVAILIKKLTTASRGTRDGRMYLAGPSEANQDLQTMSSTAVNTLNTNLAAAKAAIEQEGRGVLGIGGTYDSRIVVVHAPANMPTSWSHLASFQAQSTVATQRRRLRP